MADDPQAPDIRLDKQNLYREETFTDLHAGSLRRLTPVDAQGNDDSSRPVLYEGRATLMTPGGTLPLSFGIDASSLDEALDKFPGIAKKALEETVEEIKRIQRESQSSIVVPGSGGGGMPGGAVPGGSMPGGIPGGGKIKL